MVATIAVPPMQPQCRCVAHVIASSGAWFIAGALFFLECGAVGAKRGRVPGACGGGAVFVAHAQGQVGHTGGEPLVWRARIGVAGGCAGTERAAGARGAARPNMCRGPPNMCPHRQRAKRNMCTFREKCMAKMNLHMFRGRARG